MRMPLRAVWGSDRLKSLRKRAHPVRGKGPCPPVFFVLLMELIFFLPVVRTRA